MIVYGKTDIGRKRLSNQDCFFTKIYDPDCCCTVICDGMGGHNGGNIASRIAIDVIEQNITSMYDAYIRTKDIGFIITTALRRANRMIFARSISDPDLKGMGSTVVCAFVLDGIMYTAHVGDSRIYLFDSQDSSITQVTKDHSVVQQMIDSGQITPKEAEFNPYKHIITRALGIDHDVNVELNKVKYCPEKDIAVLCSDGFSNMVSDDQKINLLKNYSADIVCDKMIELANHNGGIDNITVSVIYGENNNKGSEFNG